MKPLNSIISIQMIQIDIPCHDGFQLKGTLYPSNPSMEKAKMVIINSATGVSKDIYHHFATYLAENGYEVLTYDYRGIAASRPKKLRGFKASFTCWGQFDFVATINLLTSRYPNHQLLVLGHSIGGTIIGMASNNDQISGIINIGAQTAYYKDWDKSKIKLFLLWHTFFPLITTLYGYFPGKQFNLLEDIPKGVIQQWHARKKTPDYMYQLHENGIEVYYDHYKGRLLTLAIEDDIIGTNRAISRVHQLFTAADKKVELIKPADIGCSKIGHFGFFSRKFKPTLWYKSVKWFDKV